jgi:hypothetical protein
VSRGFLKSYRQGIKRQRLYRQAEVASLIQLAPTSGEQAPERSVAPEVPLAESWIRD